VHADRALQNFWKKKQVHPQRKINQVEEFVILTYTRYIDCESAKDYTGELSGCSNNSKKNIPTTLVGQFEGKNILTTSFSTSSTAASTAACHARGLVITHSHKLSATLGGSTSTHPGVRKLTLNTYDFIDISNATIPTALGGSITTSPPIVVVILQQLNYIIVDYSRADRGAPDKS
jgi:hypothetical protein